MGRSTFLVCLATFVVSGTLSIGALPEPAGADVADDAAWILQTVRPDGALATNPDQRLVWPYLANQAAWGLARAAAAGNQAAAAAGWGWLDWYQAHQDANGYVTDYEVRGGVLVSTGDRDSTDAYAGTYLVAVRDMYAATGDRARLESLRTGIEGAVQAIESTQDVDGLTWATPEWHVKYLMDNAETYAGLVAAAEVADVLGDQPLAVRAAEDARRMRAGVDGLWNPTTGAYDWAVHGGGGRQVNDWSLLYPDALQQVSAVAYGLVDEPRASQILSTFVAAQPGWADPDGTARFADGTGRTGYWVVAAIALRRAGFGDGGGSASIRAASTAAGREWPFTSAEAGNLVVLDSPELPTLVSSANRPAAPDSPDPSSTATSATTVDVQTAAGPRAGPGDDAALPAAPAALGVVVAGLLAAAWGAERLARRARRRPRPA